MPLSERRSERGSVFAALFGAVVMVGILASSMNVLMRGPVTTMSDVTRRTVAENAMIAASRLSVIMASTVQAAAGDCDADGTVEPIPFRDPGTGARPTGGGYIPTSVGAQSMDPWQTEYGYCVWDHGPTRNALGCGGVGQRRLAGAPAAAQTVVSIISAGKDKIFQTSCNAYVDANADNIPDTPLLNKPAGSDDILHSYTYAEAMGVGEGIWRLKSGTPGVAEVERSLEVKDAGGTVTAAIDRTSGVGNFVGVTTNILTPRSGTGIEIGGGLKLGNDAAACPGAANVKVGTVRYNGGLIEVCHVGGWTVIGPDNLGNHTATQNLILGNFRITGLGLPLAGGDSANKTYVDTADATKVNKSGDTMTGPLIVPTPTAAGHAATKAYVDAAAGGGGADNLGNHTATNHLNMSYWRINNLQAPTAGQDATNKTYVDTAVSSKVDKAGDTMTGPLTVPTPTAAGHAATKAYVDAAGGGGGGTTNYKCFWSSGGNQPHCVRLSDGQYCYRNFTGSWSWACEIMPGWPGAGVYECFWSSGGNQPHCVRSSDGRYCYRNFTGSWSWACELMPGWPG